MKWSIKIARVAGIELKIHLTFVIFLAWIAMTYYGAGGRQAAIQGTAFVVLLFLCVLLHELGHALTAKSFGIRTPDITLLPIGGVARLERIPEQPKQELLIAIAGPLVNVAIAAVIIFALRVQATWSDLADLNTPRVGLMAKLASVNIALVLFNLIPAFPMDGGRVLRALLAMKMNYARATRVAATIGQGFAFVFGLYGLLRNHPLLIFIAFFVYLAASSESAAAQMKDFTSGLPVSEAMMTELKTLPASASLDEAAEAVLRTAHHEFAVVDETGTFLGALTRDDIIRALRRRTAASVSEVMHRGLPAVRSDEALDKAFAKMQQSGYPALPVMDSLGRLIGLITAENVSEMMIIKSLHPREGKPSWRKGHAKAHA